MKLLIWASLIYIAHAAITEGRVLNTNVIINPQDEPEDAILTVPQLITKYGYPIEVHYVTTSDGYILQLHRIPKGAKGRPAKNKVAFIQHGVLSSSADWIVAGPEKGLGYILADEGYDVWMGNNRGNSESRNHTTLNPDKDHQFWDFSWHEIGTIDLPAMIDYVLAVTGQENLYYIGHSQGTTIFYVMASEKPEYNSKIQAQFSLAPIGFMNHMTSPLMHLISFWDGPLSLLLPLIGMYEFLPTNTFLSSVGDVLCNDGSVTQILCTNALFAICGFSNIEMNATLLPTIMGHTPAGASTKQFLHYAQEINSGSFRQYDYGLTGNLGRYHSMWPPNYDLKKITIPVFLFYSHNDWLSSEVDVIKLCDKMSNCRGKLLVSESTFNHLDYLIGINAPRLVYNKLISLMARN